MNSKSKKQATAWLSIMAAAAVTIAVLIICRPKVTRYETHSVSPGETLWGIVKEYNHEAENVDMLLYETRKANGMESSVIYVGQVIEVPILG